MPTRIVLLVVVAVAAYVARARVADDSAVAPLASPPSALAEPAPRFVSRTLVLRAPELPIATDADPDPASEIVALGGIYGVVTDERDEPLAGVTITVSSPALDQSQSVITDELGAYVLEGLPIGSYRVVFFYLGSEIEVEHVLVVEHEFRPVFQVIPDPYRRPRVDEVGTDPERVGIQPDDDFIEESCIGPGCSDAVLDAGAGPRADPSEQVYDGM
jgi:hypothetical protein